MLGIYPHFLTSAALIVSVLGAPLEPLEFAATTTYANILPSVTNGGGQFFVQTTTGGGAQATAGATGTGNCPTTSTGTPKCYRYDSDFPPESEWMSLDCMISHGRSDMVTFSNDGPDEADNAIAAVQSVAGKAGIDPYVLLSTWIIG